MPKMLGPSEKHPRSARHRGVSFVIITFEEGDAIHQRYLLSVPLLIFSQSLS